MNIRAAVGIVLLLAAAVCFSGWGLWEAIEEPPDPDEAATMDYYDRERFETVKPLLPRSGVIGYREDNPPGAERIGPVNRFSQYVLAPAVLSGEADGPVVLVNGRPEAGLPPQAAGAPLPLRYDAGNGVRLYGKGP